MSQLPITRMTLYKHGVGFIERRATVNGEKLELLFRTEVAVEVGYLGDDVYPALPRETFGLHQPNRGCVDGVNLVSLPGQKHRIATLALRQAECAPAAVEPADGFCEELVRVSPVDVIRARIALVPDHAAPPG